MKQVLCLALLCLLGGCIAVADYGAAWPQAALDTALEGRWRKLPEAHDTDDQLLVFTAQDGAYDVIPYQDGEVAEDFDSVYPVKSLNIGAYRFLASRNRGLGGEMMRYTLKNGILQFHVLQSKAAKAWLEKEKKNSPLLVLRDYTAEIARLDAAAQAQLAALPDDKTIWRVTARYRKVQ